MEATPPPQDGQQGKERFDRSSELVDGRRKPLKLAIGNGMVYTLGEAAKATGLTKSGLSKAIKCGRVSANRTESGSYEIDPAELHRVFPPAVNGQPKAESVLQLDTRSKLAELAAKLESAQEQLNREREWSRELSRRLDEEASERRKLTALLTRQQEPKAQNIPEDTAPARPSFWRNLFGSR